MRAAARSPVASRAPPPNHMYLALSFSKLQSGGAWKACAERRGEEWSGVSRRSKCTRGVGHTDAPPRKTYNQSKMQTQDYPTHGHDDHAERRPPPRSKQPGSKAAGSRRQSVGEGQAHTRLHTHTHTHAHQHEGLRLGAHHQAFLGHHRADLEPERQQHIEADLQLQARQLLRAPAISVRFRKRDDELRTQPNPYQACVRTDAAEEGAAAAAGRTKPNNSTKTWTGEGAPGRGQARGRGRRGGARASRK